VHYLNPFVFKDSRSSPCWMKGAAEKKDPFSDCITCPKQPCWSSESDEKIRSFTRLPPVRHISWCSLRFYGKKTRWEACSHSSENRIHSTDISPTENRTCLREFLLSSSNDALHMCLKRTSSPKFAVARPPVIRWQKESVLCFPSWARRLPILVMITDVSGWSHLFDISEDVFVLRNKFLCLFFFDRVDDYVYDDNEDFVSKCRRSLLWLNVENRVACVTVKITPKQSAMRVRSSIRFQVWETYDHERRMSSPS